MDLRLCLSVDLVRLRLVFVKPVEDSIYTSIHCHHRLPLQSIVLLMIWSVLFRYDLKMNTSGIVKVKSLDLQKRVVLPCLFQILL